MPFTASTYYCGRSGGVRKLINLVGSWIDVSLPANGLPGASACELLDIEVDPNNQNKVYVVGETSNEVCPATFFGIGVSSDGGVTWVQPTGNYQTVVDAAFCHHKWIEVSVVDSNTIYACGIVNTNTGKGTIIKSTDGGLTFNQCAALPSIVDGQDCTSLHFITPLVGVIGMNNYVIKTIDGGASWIVMNGGSALTDISSNPIITGAITGIHIKNNQSAIIGIGPNFVFESLPALPVNNSGVAVNSWEQNSYPPGGFFDGSRLPLPIGRHLCYLNPLIAGDIWIGVSGISSLGMESGTHGSSWNFAPAPGWDVSGSGYDRSAAHFYKLNVANNGQVGFYNVNSDIYAAGYGFNNSFASYSETSPFGINAIWTWYLETPPCYLLTNCEDGSTIIVNNDLSLLIGQTISILEVPGCWTVSISQGCFGSISITIVGGPYPDCVTCIGTCYLLVDCSGQVADILTNTDLSALLGNVVTITGDNTCYTVTSAPGCQGSVPVIINGNYPNCVTCLPVSPTCWLLSNCDTGDQIITSQDLTPYVNQVIVLHGCPDTCWTVSTINDCTGSVPSISPVLYVYSTCLECAGPVPPIPPIELRPRLVKPGYTVAGQCSPEYVEKVSCSFAEQVYLYMASIRYGIKSCCIGDLDKWDIKKQLLDLKSLYDPELCKNTLCLCEAPCGVSVLIEVPVTPISCAAPSGVSSEILLSPQICPAPDTVQSAIIIFADPYGNFG